MQLLVLQERLQQQERLELRVQQERLGLRAQLQLRVQQQLVLRLEQPLLLFCHKLPKQQQR